MDAVPKFIALREGDKKTAESRVRLISFMNGMNAELKRYRRFKNMCADGVIRSENIKTGKEWAKFREDYIAFEEESHTPDEIESKCLEYCRVFLAKPGLISALSDDREINVPRYKAITEPVYKYLKELHEELVYYAGLIDRYYELHNESVTKI